jgi:hypothetical protein
MRILGPIVPHRPRWWQCSIPRTWTPALYQRGVLVSLGLDQHIENLALNVVAKAEGKPQIVGWTGAPGDRQEV